ncbi:MAG: feruloyl-CoA synthase [Arenibacterium sp.]
MTEDTQKFRAHKVIREDREDGAILLRSAYALRNPVAKSSDWLHHWADERANAVFLAERSGSGWRELTFAATLQQVRALAAGLLARGLDHTTPILILSGNSIGHGLLTLAAHYVGIPTVPVAEQYSLIPGAEAQLRHVFKLVEPKMVFAEDGEKFARALALPEFAGLQHVVQVSAANGQTTLDSLMAEDGVDVDAAADRVGPETIAKILMTSGSTSLPKGVPTTQKMMCVNQAQIQDALPFLAQRPPRIVDWLPWNHVFGGSHNFNMMLASGGSLYIDAGKPAPGLIETTIENNAMISATISFNVPVGFARLRDAMQADKSLRETFFKDLDMLFYAGASLPQDVFQDLRDMAIDVRGRAPLMTSSWGMTETAPAAIFQHEPVARSGIIGVPLTGVAVKLVPEEAERFELRVAGPSIMTGYLNAPEKTTEAFDEEGYFLTGDAVAFVDPNDMNKGLKFAGRISEDFKLMTGIWVRATQMRLDALVALGPLAADVVITGEGRSEVGVLILPGPALTREDLPPAEHGALRAEHYAEAIAKALDTLNKDAAGRSQIITRALIMAEPPSMADGEVTAKGNLNFNKLLQRRGDILNRLYDDADPAVIRLDYAL